MESTSLCYQSFSGKLSLCIGMPCYNPRKMMPQSFALTKGQKVCQQGIHGQLVLETLFIKLNKPQNVQIDGLPENGGSY